MIKFSQITVLAEDTMHTSFVRGFLKEGGFDLHRLREDLHRVVGNEPRSGASGNAWVQERFAPDLSFVRSRQSGRRAATFLVVVYDSDTKSVADSQQIFQRKAKADDTNLYSLVIPKRNIESWIRFFRTNSIDEVGDYAHTFTNKQSRDAGRRTYELIASSAAQMPPSLSLAMMEFKKLMS